MAYLTEEDIHDAYDESVEEASQWRKDYPQYERLMDNGLLDDLDENLPEVNDGSLAASLFKLAKRVIRKKLGGRAVALDRDEPWVTELANIYWSKKILPNANSKATPRRKWKDAVRKSAGFGGQPIINLFIDKGAGKAGSDFIVPYALDVKLEAGKDSDLDSDIIFWDVYYTKLQLEDMIEQAGEEIKDGVSSPINRDKKTGDITDDITTYNPPAGSDARTALGENADTHKARGSVEDALSAPERTKGKSAAAAVNELASLGGDYGEGEQSEPLNYWDVDKLTSISQTEGEEQRAGNETPRAEQESGAKKNGYHFYIAFQRGEAAPFMMIHASSGKCVRQWSNPDPTGDIPVHYLYCYQDFINPYGVGIVKLAGGTQNVLDYMRQADILATQLGLRPPKQIIGDEDEVDFDSLVYAQDADWLVGSAKVERMELANGVYNQLPGRINMYKTALNQLIPVGDISISGSESGDPNVSKTPAGVKFAAGQLSIDDEDFMENVDETFAMVAKSMINTEFANMEGTDLLKLTEDEKDLLEKAGLEFPNDTMELVILWDNVRANFDFEVDVAEDPDLEDADTLEGKLKAYELVQSDPTLNTDLAMNLKKLDKGELLSEIFGTLTKSEKIIVDITKEEAQAIVQEEQQKAIDEADKAAKPAEQPKKLGESIAWKPGDLREGERAQALADVGIEADKAPGTAPNEAKIASDIATSTHKTAADAARATTPPPAPAAPAGDQSATPQAATTPAPDEAIMRKVAELTKGQITKIMEAYNVDPQTAAAMLEAERQGFNPAEIALALRRRQIAAKKRGQPASAAPAPAPAGGSV